MKSARRVWSCWLAAALATMLGHMAGAQPFGCAPVLDSMGNGMKTVLGPTVNTDFCSNIPATQTTSSLSSTCAAFCGAQNIPLLVGVVSDGFNQTTMDQLCFGVGDTSGFVTFDPNLMGNCQQWSGALDQIQIRAASFLAALENMTYAQLQFRQGIADQVSLLVQQVSSPDFQRTMQSADDNQRLPLYLATVKASLADFFNDSRQTRLLRNAADYLGKMGAALQSALANNLPSLSNFVNSCRSPLLAVGVNNEYLLDICNQRTGNCLGPDKSAARHVGCCCATVPLTGSFGIPSSSTGGRRVAAGPGARATRELQAQAATSVMDVCAEAEQRAAGSLLERRAALQASPSGQQLLSDFQQALRSAYPSYYGRCSAGSRRLDDPAAAGGPPPPSQEEPAVRQLQMTLTSCQPQRSTVQPSLKAAFWQSTEAAYCDQLPPPPNKSVMDTAGLAGICQKFCGPETVPLLLGSTAFGFNQVEMDRICLAGELLQSNRSKLSWCQTQAQILTQVSSSAASLVAKLRVLVAEKLRFQAAARQAVANVNAEVAARAEGVLRGASAGQKIAALRALLADASGSLINKDGIAVLRMTTAITAVQTAGQQLLAALGTALQSIYNLITTCNQFFTSSGTLNEYLLDICSQTSTECLEQSDASHAGCCCGYNPMLALGKALVPTATIPGLNGPDLKDSVGVARVASRRLAASSVSVYNACGAGWAMSQADVAAAQADVQALGGQDLLDKARQQLTAAYPTFMCQKPAASTAQGSSTATAANMVSTTFAGGASTTTVPNTATAANMVSTTFAGGASTTSVPNTASGASTQETWAKGQVSLSLPVVPVAALSSVLPLTSALLRRG